jgi:hypothetical protein
LHPIQTEHAHAGFFELGGELALRLDAANQRFVSRRIQPANDIDQHLFRATYRQAGDQMKNPGLR